MSAADPTYAVSDANVDRVLAILEIMQGSSINELLKTLDTVRDLAMDAKVPKFSRANSA